MQQIPGLGRTYFPRSQEPVLAPIQLCWVAQSAYCRRTELQERHIAQTTLDLWAGFRLGTVRTEHNTEDQWHEMARQLLVISSSFQQYGRSASKSSARLSSSAPNCMRAEYDPIHPACHGVCIASHGFDPCRGCCACDSRDEAPVVHANVNGFAVCMYVFFACANVLDGNLHGE